MLRRAAMAVAVLVAVGCGERALAQTSQDVLVAGNPKIAVIDANQNGVLNEPDDCVFTAQASPSDSATTSGIAEAGLQITGTQNPGPNLLRPCTGSCFGDSFLSSDFVGVQLNSCEFASPFWSQIEADFCSTAARCRQGMSAASSQAGGRAAGLDGGGPLSVVAGELFRASTGPAGFGRVCRAGGLAVQINDDSGMTVLRDLFAFPNTQNPTHLCVNDFPVQLDSTGMFVLRTACFPIANGRADVALSGNPTAPIVTIDFSNLISCSTGTAPTMSQWGLMALMLGLLGSGVWALGRRRGFASLPLP